MGFWSIPRYGLCLLHPRVTESLTFVRRTIKFVVPGNHYRHSPYGTSVHFEHVTIIFPVGQRVKTDKKNLSQKILPRFAPV